MRLFIALTLSDEMRSALVKVSDRLAESGCGGRPTPPENFHLTLCFIGETDRIGEVICALKQVSFEPFRLSLKKTGCFGNLLWVGADGGSALPQLALRIRTELDSAGIPYDRQEFVPHITLLRKSANLPNPITVPDTEMTVDRFLLMKSEQSGGRTVYTELFSF